MATSLDRYIDFKNRLAEIGITDKDYKMTHKGEPTGVEAGFDLEVIRPYTGPNDKEYGRICFAIIGMIAHFRNRKWIQGWGYTYIMKSHHTVYFTNQSD